MQPSGRAFVKYTQGLVFSTHQLVRTHTYMHTPCHRYKVKSIKHCENTTKSVEIIAGTSGTFLMTIYLKIKLCYNLTWIYESLNKIHLARRMTGEIKIQIVESI